MWKMQSVSCLTIAAVHSVSVSVSTQCTALNFLYKYVYIFTCIATILILSNTIPDSQINNIWSVAWCQLLIISDRVLPSRWRRVSSYFGPMCHIPPAGISDHWNLRPRTSPKYDSHDTTGFVRGYWFDFDLLLRARCS